MTSTLGAVTRSHRRSHRQAIRQGPGCSSRQPRTRPAWQRRGQRACESTCREGDACLKPAPCFDAVPGGLLLDVRSGKRLYAKNHAAPRSPIDENLDQKGLRHGGNPQRGNHCRSVMGVLAGKTADEGQRPVMRFLRPMKPLLLEAFLTDGPANPTWTVANVLQRTRDSDGRIAGGAAAAARHDYARFVISAASTREIHRRSGQARTGSGASAAGRWPARPMVVTLGWALSQIQCAGRRQDGVRARVRPQGRGKAPSAAALDVARHHPSPRFHLVSQAAMLHGWRHGHNGVTLGNPRLGSGLHRDDRGRPAWPWKAGYLRARPPSGRTRTPCAWDRRRAGWRRDHAALRSGGGTRDSLEAAARLRNGFAHAAPLEARWTMCARSRRCSKGCWAPSSASRTGPRGAARGTAILRRRRPTAPVVPPVIADGRPEHAHAFAHWLLALLRGRARDVEPDAARAPIALTLSYWKLGAGLGLADARSLRSPGTNCGPAPARRSTASCASNARPRRPVAASRCAGASCRAPERLRRLAFRREEDAGQQQGHAAKLHRAQPPRRTTARANSVEPTGSPSTASAIMVADTCRRA